MLGSIFLITPTVGWATPLIWPVVIAAAGAMGYKQLTSAEDDAVLRGELNAELNSVRTITIPINETIREQVTNSVEGEVGRDRTLRFHKDGITVSFKRDLRGKFSIQVTAAETCTRREMEHRGMEFLETIIQQFSYNKMAQEMERRGANIVGEEVNENGDIVLKLRRWE